MTNISTTLGSKLRTQFNRVRGERIEVEDRWLRDLRQYKGVYDPEEVARMDIKRSRTFTRMTRIKVKSADSRLMDLVFPAGSEDNWHIEPTPNPDMQVSPMAVMQLQMALQRPPTSDEVNELLTREANVAAVNMEREIQDQLAEVRYRKIMKDVIHSGNLFGTGVMKGPLVNTAERKIWKLNPDANWYLTEAPTLTPFIESVPLWNVYPDTTATTFRDARFVYERDIMPRHQVLELADRPDFRGDVIRKYLIEHAEGDVALMFWETELRRLGWNISAAAPKSKRYEVMEYWGILSQDDLVDLGFDREMVGTELAEFWGNVWLLGDNVIKAELQPIEGVSLPYYAYYYDKDETSIFGEGIASVMRDDQKGLNASTRAMMDNAAICAGPQVEVNIDLLHPDEDPRAVYPFRVWQRSGVGVEAQHPAIRTLNMGSFTQEYLSMSQYFMNNIHEATIPSYMHGEATSKGSVGRTVGGLSMLMSAAQITFKDQLFSLDDDVMRPFLTAMYHWNMQFNPKPDIKGDFNVVVKGTSSLVAREVRAQNLEQFANSTMNQFDQPFINRYELNKQRVRVLELGDDIIVDQEQAIRNQVIDPLAHAAIHQQTGSTAKDTGVPPVGFNTGNASLPEPAGFAD
jgi:hypothetical protein